MPVRQHCLAEKGTNCPEDMPDILNCLKLRIDERQQ